MGLCISLTDLGRLPDRIVSFGIEGNIRDQMLFWLENNFQIQYFGDDAIKDGDCATRAGTKRGTGFLIMVMVPWSIRGCNGDRRFVLTLVTVAAGKAGQEKYKTTEQEKQRTHPANIKIKN